MPLGILKLLTSPRKFFLAMGFGIAETFRQRYKIRTTINATDQGMVIEHELVLRPGVTGDPIADLEAEAKRK